jgi:hypothetical protein
MFERQIEEHWFGNLAKRATPAAAPAKISPMLAYAAGCEEQEIAALHEANQRAARAPQPDPEAVILEKSVLRMYGQQSGGDPAVRAAMLAKLAEVDDLEKLSRRPGHVSLTPNSEHDYGALEKMARRQSVSAVADWLLRKIAEGVANGETESEVLEFLVRNSSQPDVILAAAEELLSLAKAA